MNKITIYTRAIQRNSDFSFLAIIKIGDNEFEIYKQITETTSNRAIIKGIAEVIAQLEEPSDIQVFCQTNFGFKYLSNNKNWCNRDVGNLLLQSINEGQHNINFTDCGETEELKNIQNDLANRLKKFKAITVENSLNNLDNTEATVYNDNDLANKEVSIFVRGICDTTTEARIGKYIAILNFKGREKEIFGEEDNTTSNRMIIKGLSEVVKLLKEPCKINFFTHTAIGLKKYYKKSQGINNDIMEELFSLIIENNHSLKEIITSSRQEELNMKLIAYKK